MLPKCGVVHPKPGAFQHFSPTFQKLFLKSGRETLKSAWFLVFHTTFRHILAILKPVVGDFYEHFSNQGFFDSLVGRLKHCGMKK